MGTAPSWIAEFGAPDAPPGVPARSERAGHRIPQALSRQGRSLLGAATALIWCASALAGSQPAYANNRVTVSSGETLTELASEYGTTISALAAANGIADPNFIEAGSTLTIPAPGQSSVSASELPASGSGDRTVTVQPGDTLWSIAAQVGTSVTALAQANDITDPNVILAGSVLVLPGPSSMELADFVEPAPTAPTASPSGTGSGGNGDSRLPAGLAGSSLLARLQPYFVGWAAVSGVPASLLEGLCWWESGWSNSVVSSTGAVGIGQLEPYTTSFVEEDLLGGMSLDPHVASDNIELTATYLGWLLQETGDNTRLALAAYYQGLSSVENNGLSPSTVQYVDGIVALSGDFS